MGTAAAVAFLLAAAALGCGDGPSGAVDASQPDAAAADAGARDAASVDGGPADAGTGDAGGPDAGPRDAGPSRIEELRAALADPAATVESLDDLMYEVAWREGWPLAESGRWLFVTRWEGAPSAVALVGDVNGWDAVAWPAEAAASGSHFFVLVDASDFAVPAEGAKYKWWGSGDVFRAPPEATAYGFDAFGEHGWVRPPAGAPWLERFPDLRSRHLEARRTVRARLPAGFVSGSPAAARARTLLMHDGQNLFHPDAIFGGWRVDEALDAGAYGDVVTVAVDNAADRMDAYTHVPDDPGGGVLGGRAADYLALLEEEVLPFARDRYGVAARGDSMMISGSSLGGLVSLWIGTQRPDLAGCIAALSPSTGWGAFGADGSSALVNLWPAVGHGPFAIYLDSGGGVTGACVDTDFDGVQEDSDDADSYCTTIQLRDTLVGLGYAFDVDLWHWWEPGAPHDETAWAERFPRALSACDAGGWLAP